MPRRDVIAQIGFACPDPDEIRIARSYRHSAYGWNWDLAGDVPPGRGPVFGLENSTSRAARVVDLWMIRHADDGGDASAGDGWSQIAKLKIAEVVRLGCG